MTAVQDSTFTDPVLDRQQLLDEVTYERRAGVVTLTFGSAWQALTSAVLGGGRRHARSLVHLQVPLTYRCDRPERDLRSASRRLGLPGPTIGLMTALDLERTQVFAAQADHAAVRAVITVGLGNLARAGAQPPRRGGLPGTINTVLLVEHRLADAAAVELAMLVAEAKAATLAECGMRSPDGRLASGTSTDAVAILWHRATGREIRHGGTATALGTAVGAVVTDAVRVAVAALP